MLRSPYYQWIGSHLDRPLDLQQWPILKREQYVEQFDQIVTDRALNATKLEQFVKRTDNPHSLLDGKYIVLHTSGTSGELAYFPYRIEDWLKGGLLATRVAPLWPPRKRVAYVAATSGHYAGISLTLNSKVGTNKLWYDVRPVEINQPQSRIVRQLNDFQPYVLSGYARPLAQLAREKSLKINPRLVVSSGEMLSASNFQLLKSRFNCQVNNVYASTECQYIGCSRDGFPMQLFEDDLIIELFPDKTLITNMNNKTAPLIRYQMNDILEPECFIDGLRFVQPIVARQEEMLELRTDAGNLESIHPIVLAELHVPGLRKWQFQRESESSFKVFIEADGDHITGSLRDEIQRILYLKGMSSVRFTIIRQDSIPQGNGGKFKLVV